MYDVSVSNINSNLPVYLSAMNETGVLSLSFTVVEGNSILNV